MSREKWAETLFTSEKKTKLGFSALTRLFQAFLWLRAGKKKSPNTLQDKQKYWFWPIFLPDAEIGLYSGAVIINSSVNAQPAEIYTGA